MTSKSTEVLPSYLLVGVMWTKSVRPPGDAEDPELILRVDHNCVYRYSVISFVGGQVAGRGIAVK